MKPGGEAAAAIDVSLSDELPNPYESPPGDDGPPVP